MSDIERLAAVSFEMIVALMRESAARLTRAEAAEAKVATLTEALEKHGRHHSRCNTQLRVTVNGIAAVNDSICNCGWDAALAAARGEG